MRTSLTRVHTHFHRLISTFVLTVYVLLVIDFLKIFHYFT